MAITPPYIRLSNGDIITFEKLGPKTTAVLSNSEGVLIRKGNALIGATEKELANTIILGYPDPKPTIVEEVSPPPKLPSSYVKLSNGDIITFEKLGPKTTAVLSNSTGILIRKGNPSFSVTEKVLAEEIILGYEDPKPTIVEEVLPSPPPPKPKPTPEKVEEQRLQTESTDKNQLEQSNATTVDAKKIENATPSDLKAMGIAKLPLLLLIIGNQVKTIIEPALRNLIATYIQKFLDMGSCPDKDTLEKIKQQRNLIVSQLNKIGRTLNIITISLTGISTFLSILQIFIKGLDLAKIAAKIAALVSPPLAATLPTTLNTISQAKNEAIINEKGNSRLQILTSILGGAALVSSMIGGFILIAITLLNSIDGFLKECDPTLDTNNSNDLTANNNLIPISKEIQDIANIQSQAEQTQNETTYKGFNIVIEEVPYTPTVNRRRALGQNQDGITLIQTELSFTTDDQTLIDELKLIIDRDNLKAY